MRGVSPVRRGGHAIPTGSTVPTLLNVELVGGQEVFGRPAQIASGHGVFCPTPLMPSMTCAHVGKNPHAAVVRAVDRGERGGWTSGRFRAVPVSRSRHVCSRPSSAPAPSARSGRALRRTGMDPSLALSDSHASLTLRQSATRRGRAPTGHTHHPPTRRLSVSARAVSGHQTPGGMKLAARQGKAPVWGGARHTCCSAVGRPRCLNTRCGPTGRRPRVRKEPDDATERCHDA